MHGRRQCMREQTAARGWCFTATRSTVRRAGHACEAGVRRGEARWISRQERCAPAGPCRTRSRWELQPRRQNHPCPGRRPWPCCRAACCRRPSRPRRRRSQHGHHGDWPSSAADGRRSSSGSTCDLLRVRHASRAASTARRRRALHSGLLPVARLIARRGGGKAHGHCFAPFSGYGWFHSLLTVWIEHVYKTTPPKFTKSYDVT